MRRLTFLLAAIPFAAAAQQPQLDPAAQAQALGQELGECFQGRIGFHAQLIAAQQQIAVLQKQIAELQAKPKAPPAETPPAVKQ